MQSNENLLNLTTKCWISAFNAQGLKVIKVVVQIGAVKIYVAEMEVLRKNERHSEIQFTTKIVRKISLGCRYFILWNFHSQLHIWCPIMPKLTVLALKSWDFTANSIGYLVMKLRVHKSCKIWFGKDYYHSVHWKPLMTHVHDETLWIDLVTYHPIDPSTFPSHYPGKTYVCGYVGNYQCWAGIKKCENWTGFQTGSQFETLTVSHWMMFFMKPSYRVYCNMIIGPLKP